ncbi:m-AAA protease-interacting protein 1, mitochondrial [Eucyclogobius newberryi]|uniref:m-AAA protease-interacting protein 1, mitochondrial n=1 Tax=Eucyclogobius newberryi TaxID=166745 RepID=UPI003B5B79FF
MHPARSLRSLRSLRSGLSLCTARSGDHCVRQRSWRAGPGAALSRDRAAVVGQRLTTGPGWRLLSAAGHSCSRALCSGPGQDREERDLSLVTVVGSPDPITWLRCRLIIILINLYFEVDLASEEFLSGAKQALVQVSHLMSTGRFHRLKGLVSDEMREYVETRTMTLSRTQQLKLLVNTDDIIFLLPEDVSVVFDQYGRKYCSIVMRFWFLTTLEGPEDPEATRIFKVAPSQDGCQQTKVATAVYEFRRELTQGASPDWTVTTVWHWHWALAPKAPD